MQGFLCYTSTLVKLDMLEGPLAVSDSKELNPILNKTIIIPVTIKHELDHIDFCLFYKVYFKKD